MNLGLQRRKNVFNELETKKQRRNLYKEKKRPVRQAIKQPIITVEKMDVR